MKRTLWLGAAALAAGLLAGCGLALIGAGGAAAYSTIEDRRSAGTRIEDEGIELRASNRIDQRYGFKVHVNVTSYNRSVLITGEVPDARTREEIEKIVAAVPNVRALTNELEIGAVSPLSARTGDSLITSNVKARFLGAKGFNPLHVKVVTEAGVVYLMGVVTDVEANAAADIARTTDGVRKVVKVFEYCRSGEDLCRPRPAPPVDKSKPAA
jgi:osmotically-inducible protein OsmY